MTEPERDESQLDLPALARFLSRPIRSVEVAMSDWPGGRWHGPSTIHTNLAVIRTDEGALVFRYGLVDSHLLDGTHDDDVFAGQCPEGTIALLSKEDMADLDDGHALLPSSGLAPMELVSLATLFPDCGRIFVPDATACEISFTQTIRDGAFRFDVSGIRIYSREASTLLERGAGGMMECSVQS